MLRVLVFGVVALFLISLATFRISAALADDALAMSAFGLGLSAAVLAMWSFTRSGGQARAGGAESKPSTGFQDISDARFAEWGLTSAERDVALFTLKGLSISEIADLRGTSVGTVKAQSNAIYKKADVSSRTQLVALFVEDLVAADLSRPAYAARPSMAEAMADDPESARRASDRAEVA